MIRRILKIIVSFFLILGAFSIPIFFTPLGEIPLTALLRVGDIEPIDFKTLKLNDNPNQYLLCPADLCTDTPQQLSPVFDISVNELQANWEEMLSEQPKIESVNSSQNGAQQDIVQRTRLVRYPDIITVAFYPTGANQSTFAIYSRSIYGRSDFGANKTRIDTWIDRLKTLSSR